MMPFSVLRIWGTGILSWALLAGAVACAYQAYKHFDLSRSTVTDRERLPPSDADRTTSDTAVRYSDDAPPPTSDADYQSRQRQRAWAYTTGAILLLGWSFGGFVPVRWLLSSANGPVAQPLAANREIIVERPDGSKLHVTIAGRDDGPTLVLTHGWSLDVSTWDYMQRRLAERHRLVMWDLPGLGKSQGPADRHYSMEKLAHDLEAVVKATANRSPVVLVSHSIGTMLTQTFCRLHPKLLDAKIAGIVLVHATYVNPLRTCFLASLASALELPLITPLNYLTIALAPLAWLSNWQSYLNGSLHVSTRLSTFSGKQSAAQLDHAARLAVESWPGVIARGNLAMQRFNEQRTLPTIDKPVLLIAGQHDRMTLPSAAEAMATMLPNERLLPVAAGHLSYWEEPDAVANAIGEFVEFVVRQEESAPSNNQISEKAV
jgi:pimeloyl-ACP methyl ester carboxylesterase